MNKIKNIYKILALVLISLNVSALTFTEGVLNEIDALAAALLGGTMVQVEVYEYEVPLNANQDFETVDGQYAEQVQDANGLGTPLVLGRYEVDSRVFIQQLDGSWLGSFQGQPCTVPAGSSLTGSAYCYSGGGTMTIQPLTRTGLHDQVANNSEAILHNSRVTNDRLNTLESVVVGTVTEIVNAVTVIEGDIINIENNFTTIENNFTTLVNNITDGTLGAGVDGQSAYQLWLATNVNGTEAEFLASLVGSAGQSAYTLWSESNTGTEADFLASLVGVGTTGTAGIPGATGQSSYELWLLSNTGTEAEFLASLVGADGDDFDGDARLTQAELDILELERTLQGVDASGNDVSGDSTTTTINGNATDITDLENKTTSLTYTNASVDDDGNYVAPVTTINSGRLEVGLNKIIIQGATYDFSTTILSDNTTFDFTGDTPQEAADKVRAAFTAGTLSQDQIDAARTNFDRISTDGATNVLGTDLYLGSAELVEGVEVLVDVRVDESNLIVTHQSTEIEYNVANELADSSNRLDSLIVSLSDMTESDLVTIRGTIASIEAELLAGGTAVDNLITQVTSTDTRVSRNSSEIDINTNNIDVNANIISMQQQAIASVRAIVESETVHRMANTNNINEIYGILADHERRISALEGYHQAVDKSFSKVFDDGLGNKLVMHFDADGTQRGQTHQLTFLENPVIYSKDAVLWTNDNILVNAITRIPLDPQPKRSEDQLRWKDIGV